MSSRWWRKAELLWDVACALSIVGIWPRFIEPNLLGVTRLTLPIRNLPPALLGLRIVHFSDLHFGPDVSDRYLAHLAETILRLRGDLLMFTGDFINYANLIQPQRLQAFLRRLSAPLGCYAILGNHDYEAYVGINPAGEYDTIENVPMEAVKALKRLWRKHPLAKRHASTLGRLRPHEQLMALLEESPFKLLHNETHQIAVEGAGLNICGLGEYMAKDLDLEKAFKTYDTTLPGIILAHNPDAVSRLKNYPGELILAGHIHGGQVNLPWVRDRFVISESPQYIQGSFLVDDRWLYVSRGVGSPVRFRWRTVPEVTTITLVRAEP